GMELLADGQIELLLESLAEDVALAGSKVGFVDVLRIGAGGDGHAHLARLNVVDSDLAGIDGGDVIGAIAIPSGIAGKSRFGILRILDAEHRIHEGGKVAEVDAAHRSVELVKRVRLAILGNAPAGKVPVIGEVREQGVLSCFV